jgi:LmbE family N-acetylglucosaminyl deacetylase
MTVLPIPGSHPRVLGVYAHPDDETFCSGGALARYAKAGCEIMVVSATRGQAGQIRSTDLATRKTLAQVREAELRLACARIGVSHVACWDYLDGMLAEVNADELENRIRHLIRAFRPDVVFSFDADGAYGHPDHIAISRATTAAVLRAEHALGAPPPRLYHAIFPPRRRLLRDHLVKWLIEVGPEFRGDSEFVHGLLLLAEEASALRYIDDYLEVKWFPTGFNILEQGEPASALFLLLSGHADVVREDAQGQRTLVTRLLPGQFFGEQGIARRKPHNAHVIAADSATCLVLTPRQPTLFEGRGESAPALTLGTRLDSTRKGSGAAICLDVKDFMDAKLQALAAYRSQFPIAPDMLPAEIFHDLFGAEYFVYVQSLDRAGNQLVPQAAAA